MPHLDLRGARLHYHDQGRGSALLLLHGWALDLRLWQRQLAELGTACRVVAVDRRGFGRSGGNTSVDRDAADLRVLCLRLGLRRVAVLGHSQGTRVALRLAQSRSLAVRALLLDGPPAPRGRQDAGAEDPPLAHYRDLVARAGLNAFRRAWRQHPLLRLHGAGRGAQRQLQRMLLRYPGKDLKRQPAAAVRQLVVHPARIRVPTLVLCGARDQPQRIVAAAELARQLPRARYQRIAGAGHLPNLDAPRQYTRQVAGFLRRHR